MPRARSAMNPQRSFDVFGFPEETSKPLNLADTYSSDDDEITVKVQVPTFLPQINVEEEDNEPTLITPAPEVRYPGIGLAMALFFGLAIWSLPLYYIVTRLLK